MNCQPEVPSIMFMKLRLFMNDQEIRLFNNEPDKPATLKLSSQTKFVLMLMNVHELFMKMHKLSSLSLLTCKIHIVL